MARAAGRVVVVAALAVVCFFFLSPRPCAGAGDELVAGELLAPGKPLVSDGGAFALGFFSPSISTPDRQYLGIWYNSIPVNTVVWVANRETPITNGTSAPRLALDNDSSNLVLSDADGRAVWTTGMASGSPPAALAVLTNAGNLVLRSANGTALWQSFDHPADTFLPGMKVWLNHRTHEGGRLVSWSSPEDPSPGRFSYGMDPDTALQLLVWDGTRPHWRSPVWNGYTVQASYVSGTGTVVYTAIVDTEDEISNTFTVSPGAAPTRFVLTSSGQFQLLGWNGSASAWATVGSWPSSGCSRYGYCGPYGYCDVAAAACRCLDGFEPAWATGGDFSKGCRRKEPLPPCGHGSGFLAMAGVKVPDKFVLDGGNRSAEECAARCAGNCSCMAYAYAKLQSSSAKGDVRRCLLWAGDLVDTQMIGPLWASLADTLYLRVPLPPAGSAEKGRKTESQKKLVPGSANTSTEIGEGEHAEDLEFPSVRFVDIVAATGNFSKAFMIGRGGFGKVYKGTLESGREVAVKRLSKDSDQGTEEFKNEAILIAKLQHRNLVRLLGCCTEGAEKLLIYEYLPNKGLDAILFDSERKSVLDWPTRLEIIKGVARGLLYLHQDSRLTVIHRDLKASNVLLDAEMRPKIADFGMAKIFCDNQQNANTKRVVGTFGYIAPEYSTEGVFSVKSDVYSFGVLLLEIVSGVRISSPDDIMEFPSLIVYAWNLWREGKAGGLVDPSIAGSCSQEEALLCIHVGLLCVEGDPSRRPLMSAVVSILENGSGSSSSTLSLPKPNQPAYLALMEAKRDDLENTRNSITMTVLQGR
ncbi:hypothetical protein BRADI_4g37220v3 [Brachypodium distachyon]|uniref:Receptor-like serine/threonine-protein kinase n=1 Tax=Brachypodium distachyon TaxID=15368 RepID=A0A0Q3HD16_BRADI|nr:hypothetical protein BRADI_4g37220v3 [Brachypodium distachyon]